MSSKEWNKMPEHTPGQVFVKGATIYQDTGNSRRRVAECYLSRPGSYSSPLAKANAERLALCWNTHDELLVALEALLIEGPKSVRDLGDLVDPVTYSAAVSRARAAIQQAKGIDIGDRAFALPGPDGPEDHDDGE